MKLKDLKPYLSKYNHICLKFKNVNMGASMREVCYNILRDMTDEYLDYEIERIETNKASTLNIILYDRN